jgi:hypothetical protein
VKQEEVSVVTTDKKGVKAVQLLVRYRYNPHFWAAKNLFSRPNQNSWFRKKSVFARFQKAEESPHVLGRIAEIAETQMRTNNSEKIQL